MSIITEIKTSVVSDLPQERGLIITGGGWELRGGIVRRAALSDTPNNTIHAQSIHELIAFLAEKHPGPGLSRALARVGYTSPISSDSSS